MAEERIRVEIGFDGGQIMGALVTPASADELERAIGEGRNGSLTLEAIDGRYAVAVGRILYVKRFSREARVGFGSE